jgi:methionyl-tRNA synthetase
MATMLDMLGVDPSRRTFADTVFGGDADYGKPLIPVGKGHEGVLFPVLRSDR